MISHFLLLHALSVGNGGLRGLLSRCYPLWSRSESFTSPSSYAVFPRFFFSAAFYSSFGEAFLREDVILFSPSLVFFLIHPKCAPFCSARSPGVPCDLVFVLVSDRTFAPRLQVGKPCPPVLLLQRSLPHFPGLEIP